MSYKQAGWYSDPSGNASKLRYWDGAQWTNEFSDVQPESPFAQSSPSAQVAVQPAQPEVVVVETPGDYPPQAQANQVYGQPPYQAQANQVYGQPPYQGGAAPGYTDDRKQTLRMVAFIFNLIAMITVCWLVIPLAWMLPMTIYSWGIYKGTKPNTTVFAVCTLIFLSLVGGILLLVSGEDRPNTQYR